MLDTNDGTRLSKLYEELRLKLLDLTRRNQLLNYSLRPRSRRFIQIVGTTLESVHGKLVNDEAPLRIDPLPEPDDVPAEERTEEFAAELNRAKATEVEYLAALEAMTSTGRDDEPALERLDRELRDRLRANLGLPPRPPRKNINRVDHARSLGIEPNYDLDQFTELGVRALQTMKFPDELEALLGQISNDAKLAEQEMGLSTLYLAFGFLEWYESDTSDKKAFAPLLLLPVSLQEIKIRGKSVFSVGAREGGAEANLSLQKLLEQRGRVLPDFEADEESGTASIEPYLAQVKSSVDGLKNWQVHRWLVLGHFSFGRFAMYADLDRKNWRDVAAHDLVGSILHGVEKREDPNALRPTPEDYLIDDPEIERVAPFLIHDADASQHSALIDAMRGRNLVIQGPPGTGKSQTIANVIANLVAAGKRVLFLAEKLAALEVVKRRLDRAGLGHFCLELHSDKILPKSVISSLHERYQLDARTSSADATPTIDPVWLQSRREISLYVNALNREADDGTTAFGLIWEALRARRSYADLLSEFSSVAVSAELLADPARRSHIRAELRVLSSMQRSFTETFGCPVRSSPWAQVTFGDFPAFEASRFVDALIAFREQVRATAAVIARHEETGARGADDLVALVELERSLGALPEERLLAAIAGLDLDDFERALSIRSDLLATEADLTQFPNLRHEDPTRLAVAAGFLRSPAAAEFCDRSPDDAHNSAESELVAISELVRRVEGVLPMLDALGLDRDTPSGWLSAAAAAVAVLSVTPEYDRRWLLQFQNAEEPDVTKARSRLKKLLEADAHWSHRMSGYRRADVPSSQSLKAAAEVLRKCGLKRLLVKFDGALRAATDLCSKIGVDPSQPEDLDALARHLDEVASFEADAGLQRLFGSAWSGLSTPVDAVAEGIRIRLFLQSKVASLAGGKEVLAHVMALSPEQVNLLGPLRDDSSSFLQLAADARDRLGDKSTAKLLSESRTRISYLTGFLTLDPNRALAGLDAPIRAIARVYELVARAGRIRMALAEHSTAESTLRLGSSQERVNELRIAIAWVRTVRAARISEGLRVSLLSNEARRAAAAVMNAAREWAFVQTDFETVLAALTEFDVAILANLPPNEVIALVDNLECHSAELPYFISVRQQRAKLVALGLSDFLSACDRASPDPSLVPGLFDALATERLATAARRTHALASNNGDALEVRRKTFAERDREKIRVDREIIRKRLLSVSPPVGSSNGPRKQWTEMSLLENEFPKQRRFTPVRQLLNRAGGAIQTLKPCLMMSPLSLAKFASPKALEFDALVIDEASQMRPEDALGGLLRAKQIIVVGDQKQLPPTDFFSRAEASIEDNEDIDDLDAESILEACESTFRQSRRLKWHYRSRCESLIAFSNASFYGGTLVTFPSAKPGSFSVDLVRVDGVYQGKCNPDEAARLAQEAVEFMRHFADAPSGDIPTLGIVAVNVEQRDFIQEELRRLSANDELVEKYLEKIEARGEPLFVKNLENVQGDERDYIFISMTYGRRRGGVALAQNFGAINRKQGHRRLNVLFTRARLRIGLFTSFGSADVRLEEKSSDGVRALKQYLEYAETRGKAAAKTTGRDPDSDFEIEVADRLRARGYEVRMQVGVSSFRIDLGVIHPDHAEQFLAGVECDGARYHSSKSARDRDRLREEILQSLGWDLVRVWSTDWYDNPDLETDRLAHKLEALRRRPRSPFESYRFFYDQKESAVDLDLSEEQGRQSAAPAEDIVEFTPDTRDSQQGSGITISQLPRAEPPPRISGEPEQIAIKGPLTATEASKALEAFREMRIRPAMGEWDAQRSILRTAMIEIFVRQRINDPEMWYSSIPQYLRTGTNPVEKTRFLDEICGIVDRIDSGVIDPCRSTARIVNSAPALDQLTLQPVSTPPNNFNTLGAIAYRWADITDIARPSRDRFHDPDYTSVLRAMVAHVVATEGPIFEDTLIERIARAHDLHRSGNQIRQRVMSLLPPGARRDRKNNQVVVWPVGAEPGHLFPFRRDPTGKRSHEEVPVEELASLAEPFLRLRLDDEGILRRMADEFQLGRLRASTRARFETALAIARRSPIPRN